MKILLFFSWRFSRWKKISIKISARACFHSNSVLCAGDACAVVHSQHHCIVRVIKLLNKFHLSPLLSLRTQKRERKNENLFRHSRSAKNGKFSRRKLQKCFLLSLGSMGFEMANKYSGKYFSQNCRGYTDAVFQSVTRRTPVNCHTLLVVTPSPAKPIEHLSQWIDSDVLYKRIIQTVVRYLGKRIKGGIESVKSI